MKLIGDLLYLCSKLVSRKRRFIPDSMTRDIISEVLMRMPNPEENWKKYSADMKEILFNDFMEKYRFASAYDRNMARQAWNQTCMDRFSDFLAKARKKAKKMAKSDNLADLKGHGPKGIRTEIWDDLVDIWMTSEWEKKFIAGKSNRASKPDCMVHIGGLRSFGQHLKTMEVKYKHLVSYSELYSRVHKKKRW